MWIVVLFTNRRFVVELVLVMCFTIACSSLGDFSGRALKTVSHVMYYLPGECPCIRHKSYSHLDRLNTTFSSTSREVQSTLSSTAGYGTKRFRLPPRARTERIIHLCHPIIIALAISTSYSPRCRVRRCRGDNKRQSYGVVSSPRLQYRIRTSSTVPHLVLVVLQQCRRGARFQSFWLILGANTLTV